MCVCVRACVRACVYILVYNNNIYNNNICCVCASDMNLCFFYLFV